MDWFEEKRKIGARAYQGKNPYAIEYPISQPVCQFCGKALDKDKGELDHGCLDCAGSIYQREDGSEFCQHCEDKKSEYIFSVLDTDNARMPTPHGPYRIWKDYKNDCWCVDTPNGIIDGFSGMSDCIDCCKEHLKDQYDDHTTIKHLNKKKLVIKEKL